MMVPSSREMTRAWKPRPGTLLAFVPTHASPVQVPPRSSSCHPGGGGSDQAGLWLRWALVPQRGGKGRKRPLSPG